MRIVYNLTASLVLSVTCFSLSAQTYKADRLRKAVEVTGVQVVPDSLFPDRTIYLTAKDGRRLCLRTSPMGEVEHIGIPLFNDMMRLLQPSPVYDFLEYALLNWKYKVNPNQLHLSKVIFRHGSWQTLLKENICDCACSIENKDDKLYIVTWKRQEKDVAVLGIPIDYELLNNDTRRNMERNFVRELSDYHPTIVRSEPTPIYEDMLSIYGTEGLFVKPGNWYLIELLNQNVYYQLTTVYEQADTIIKEKPVKMNIETVVPVVVNDLEYPTATFANLMMCDDSSVADVTIDMDFHLSNYHHQQISMPLSQLKSFCRQQGCSFFFACDGVLGEQLRGIMFISNLAKGYNHLCSLHLQKEQLTSTNPTIQADIYLYIPPISKEKLFGTAPTKKSNANFKLP